MKNKWVVMAKGIVGVGVIGEDRIAFLNECVEKGILVWDIKHLDSNAILFSIPLKDVPLLRIIRRKYQVQIHFQSRFGLPFWYKRARKNYGFVMGAFTFTVLIFLLSNMVWGIQITGCSKAVEYRIEKQLKELGVKKGAIQFMLETPQEIQKKLTDGNEDITWIGVNLKGTVYHLRVVEKTIPKATVISGPRHLIAKKSGVVTYVLAKKGQSQITVHQYVKRGQVLISGYIGQETKPRMVPATGTVLGETWYKASVKVPMKRQISLLTGKSKTSYGFEVLNHRLILPRIKKTNYASSRVMTTQHPLYFFKWRLPISLIKKTIHEEENYQESYTMEDVRILGKEIASKQVLKKLPKDASIKGIKVLRETNTNGKVELIYHFQIIENIGAYRKISKEPSVNDRGKQNH